MSLILTAVDALDVFADVFVFLDGAPLCSFCFCGPYFRKNTCLRLMSKSLYTSVLELMLFFFSMFIEVIAIANPWLYSVKFRMGGSYTQTLAASLLYTLAKAGFH